ncbi:MAG: hypothetical protein CVU39_23325 [Chloroflexi bacterium HGW-Chloroflexi-10]|nr:MAG: hypothetical protein CVU39_23325 [Chloroflexi bacterium HGW-Chloroflexi-10]
MMKKIVVLVVFLVIFLVMVVMGNPNSVDAGRPVVPTPGGSTSDQMNALSAALSQVSSPDMQKSLQEKINGLEYQEAVRASGIANPAPKAKSYCEGAPQAKESDLLENTRIQGILDASQGPFSSQMLRASNQWQGIFNAYWFHVYAGSSGEETNNGAVIIWIEDLNQLQFIPDPNPDGALTITAEHGTRLELTTANGYTRYFDIPAQQFVSDIATQLQAIDLPPIPTPLFDPCVQ